MTRWHSTSSGRTNFEQTGHLIPLKETSCTGSECAAKTRPNGVLSGVLDPDSGGDSGVPKPLCDAGMLRGWPGCRFNTLDRLRARSLASVPLEEWWAPASREDSPPPAAAVAAVAPVVSPEPAETRGLDVVVLCLPPIPMGNRLSEQTAIDAH